MEDAVVDVSGALVASERIAGSSRTLTCLAVVGPSLEFSLKSGRFFLGIVFVVGFFPIFDELGITFVGFENIASHPCFSCGTAPRIVDEPDRNAEGLLELKTEPLTDGGNARNCLGRASFPLAIEIVLRFLRADLGNGDEANLR